MVNPALKLSDLFVNFGPTPAIIGLNADIQNGSLTAVVGPNGAGKSTLLKAIVGQLRPASGKVTFGGLKRHEVAYLPQQSAIERNFPITVLEIVNMGLWHQTGPFGTLRKQHRQDVERAIDAVGLTGLENRTVGQLSGGQQRGQAQANQHAEHPAQNTPAHAHDPAVPHLRQSSS